MAVTASARLRVDDRSAIATARRAAEQMARKLGFDEVATGEVAIVASELATNLIRHAGGGEVFLLPNQTVAGLAVIALDRGPGIRNVGKAMHDGMSTAGGSGNGLGAVRRLAASFDLHSSSGEGTVVVAHMGAWQETGVGGLALPMNGETVSGDAWAFARSGPILTLLLADGLGHGEDAAIAAATAVRALEARPSPELQVQRMHGALARTRGAAAAVVRLDLEARTLRIAGIGNIVTTIVTSERTKVLPSMNGTLGGRIERINAYDYPLETGALVVMHSDGSRSGWDAARYPGAGLRDPLTLAALVVRDFGRGTDDVSAVVARVPEAVA